MNGGRAEAQQVTELKKDGSQDMSKEKLMNDQRVLAEKHQGHEQTKVATKEKQTKLNSLLLHMEYP